MKRNTLLLHAATAILAVLIIRSSGSAASPTIDNSVIVDSIHVYTTYSNGSVRDSGTALRTSNGSFFKSGVWKSYYANGQLKDSGFFADRRSVGEYKQFHHDGTVKSKLVLSFFGSDSIPLHKVCRFDKNGNLTLEGSLLDGKPFGTFRRHHNNAVVDIMSFNKGRELSIPQDFRASRSFIRDSLDQLHIESDIKLVNGHKKVHLGKGFPADIDLKGDSANYTTAIIEGFSDTALYASMFAYDFSDGPENLRFTGVTTIPFDSITAVHFSVRHPKAVRTTGMLLEMTGLLILVEIMTIPTIVGHPENTFDKSALPFFIAAPVFYIPGNILIKKSRMKAYPVDDGWRFQSTRK